MSTTSPLCNQETLDALVEALRDGGGVGDIDALLEVHPKDARLHFLRGSVLAGERRYEDGMAAIGQALALEPGYDIARFQLGFLQFTSGDPTSASRTWEPFMQADDGDPLRLFSEGLMALTTDDVSTALDKLDRGVRNNTENAALNRDMSLLVAELRRQRGDDAAEATSETDLLLRQLGLGSKH